MSHFEYRHAVHLINRALALLASFPRRKINRGSLRRIALELDLLRARYGQPRPELRRN